METIEERKRADHPEGTVDEPPGDGDFADRSADQCEWNDGAAGDKTNAQHPGVADRIAIRADEEHRDYEMAEREPIGPITDERKGRIGFLQAKQNESDPAAKSSQRFVRGRVVDAEPATKQG